MHRLRAFIMLFLFVTLWTTPHVRPVRAQDVSPALLGTYTSATPLRQVAIADGYAYLIGDQSPTLDIVDVRNPESPAHVGFYTAPSPITDIVVEGPYAYITTDGSGLRIVNIMNRAAPVNVGVYTKTLTTYNVRKAGRYVYVAAGLNGLLIIDVDNPKVPVEVGAIAWQDGYGLKALRVEILRGQAYVYAEYNRSALYATLFVIDITDVTQPRQLGSLAISGSETLLAATSGYVVLRGFMAGLEIIDVQTPTAPQRTDTFIGTTSWWATAAVPHGRYLYVSSIQFNDADADPRAGLRIVDIANPLVPAEVGVALPNERTWDVAVAGKVVYVITDSGLALLTQGYTLPHAVYLPVQFVAP